MAASTPDSDLNLSQYEQLRVVGAGGFGRALLVRRKVDALVLVLKEVSLDAIGGEKYQEMARLEAEILSNFSHPNIVQIFKYFEEKGCLYLELEFCDGGDLDQAIDNQQETGELFPEPKIRSWFAQLADTVHYLHGRKILHRDIKAQNVFLTDGGETLKLGDFGIAKILDQTGQVVTTRIGTCTHFSPEFCEDNPYDAKADVWALGVILYQLASLNLPFIGANELQIYKKIVRGIREPIPEGFSPELIQLIDRLLTLSPEARPIMREVVEDSWLVPGMLELEQRREAFSENESKAKELYQQKVAPFKANYWSGLQRLSRTPNANSSDTRWLITPCGVQDLLSFGDMTLIVCAQGEVIALAGLSPARCRKETSTNDATPFISWRSRISVPEPVRSWKTHLHCAADQTKSRIYLTFEDRDGIFFVELNQLANAKSTPIAVAAASSFGATNNDFLGLAAVDYRLFVRGRLPWPKEREFWGLQCDAKNRLILCCDMTVKHNIGIWSAEDGHFLGEIGYNKEAPTAIASKFAPFRCAIHFFNDTTSLIAVTDHRNSWLHLFKATFKPSNGGATFVSSEWVKSDVRKGTTPGLVRYPLGVHFDAAGNLWVSDSGNGRIQLFSTNLDFVLKPICTLPTDSKGWTRAIKTFVDPADNFRPFVVAGMYGGVDDLRELICYYQPS